MMSIDLIGSQCKAKRHKRKPYALLGGSLRFLLGLVLGARVATVILRVGLLLLLRLGLQVGQTLALDVALDLLLVFVLQIGPARLEGAGALDLLGLAAEAALCIEEASSVIPVGSLSVTEGRGADLPGVRKRQKYTSTLPMRSSPASIFSVRNPS